MKNRTFVDCFVLMGTALSLRGGKPLPQMDRPLLQGYSPTLVSLTLEIQTFLIDPKNMDFETSLLLTQRWIDPRLGPDPSTRSLAVAGQVWSPKILNLEGKGGRDPKGEDAVFWRGYGDRGDVVLVERLRIWGRCTKRLQDFPFDSQFCQITFGSYRFTREEVEVVWTDDAPVVILSSFDQTEFRLGNIHTYVEVDVRQSGNFSGAVVQLHLQRDPYHHIICHFVPSLLIALVNYSSLLLNLNNRLEKYLFNILACTFHSIFYYLSVCGHPAQYFKASDVFVSICGCFSLLMLAETVLIDCVCSEEDEEYRNGRRTSKKRYPSSEDPRTPRIPSTRSGRLSWSLELRGEVEHKLHNDKGLVTTYWLLLPTFLYI